MRAGGPRSPSRKNTCPQSGEAKTRVMLRPMTHADITLEDGFTALRDMRARIEDSFARFGEAGRFWLLSWLRPAEHLARLLLFVMARALTLPPPRARPGTRSAMHARTCGFRFALSAARPSPWRRRTRHAAYARPPRFVDAFAACFRDRETERRLAEERRALAAAARLQRPALPPPRPPFPPRPLDARIAALARVLAAPERLARRIARRLSPAATRRLLSPARLTGHTPCAGVTLHIHHRAWAVAFPDSS